MTADVQMTPEMQALLDRLAAAEARMLEAEETLSAIRNGEVNGLVVAGPHGDQVFTLKGTDHPYRVMMEAMEEGATTLGTDGTILFCNRRFASMLRLPHAQVLGAPMTQFLAPEYQPHFAELIMACRLDGVRNEVVLLAGDGTRVPVSLACGALPEGETESLCLVATDLTAQKAAEATIRRQNEELERRVEERTAELVQANAALRESEERYHRLFDSMTEGFLLAELMRDDAGKPMDFRIIEANLAYESVLGCRREEAIGRTLFELFPRLAYDRFEAHVYVAQTGKPLRWQGLFEPTGRYYEGFYYSPRPDQLAGIFMDITERKQAEEALQASLHEKEVLLKEIHHRVKNNMQVISSLVSLQADILDNPALQPLFNDLRDRVRTMALVHEKLYQSESLARVDFAEYTQSLLSYLWRAHGEAAADVRLTLEVQPVSISIEQAVPCGLLLNELVTNALEHAFRDRADGELTVALHAGPDGKVCLRVSDNGVGLPVNWRQSPSLGLQLVQMLTGQVRGTLDVRTDGGTTFALTFAQSRAS